MEKKTALQGKDLMLWVDHKFRDSAPDGSLGVISLSTDCQLNLQPVTTDAETKDADVNSFDIDKFNWMVQNTSQIVADDTELAELHKLMVAKTVVAVRFGIAWNNNDEGADYEDPAYADSNGFLEQTPYLEGHAKIVSINSTGSVGGKATTVISLQGVTNLHSSDDQAFMEEETDTGDIAEGEDTEEIAPNP